MQQPLQLLHAGSGALATASKTLNDKPLVPVSLFEDPQLKVA